ncbi:MAG: pitrilysin family protein [bacterium]
MYKQTTLQNGLRLITAPIQGTKTTAVLVIFSTGSKYENKQNKGISHFLEHMMFKGTAKRPEAFSVTEDLDAIGSEYNAFTSKEYTGYWIKAAGQHLETSLDILSDMLLNSKFDPEEIKREKGVIIEELNMYIDDPKMYIDEIFENLLYGDCPAGWDVIGTKKTIKSFNRKDFLKYLNSQYVTKNCFVIMAGQVPKNAKSLVNNYFKKLPNTNPKKKQRVIEKQTAPRVKIKTKKTDQAHILLGVRGLPFGHKDEHIAKLLSVVLGGGLSSRLSIEIREKHGLAYYVRADHEKHSDTGYLATRSGVPIKKVDKAIKIILKEYKRIAEEKMNIKELDRVKELIIGRTLIQLESSSSTAQWYGIQSTIMNQQLNKRKIVEPNEFISTIKKITPEDIQRVAKKIFVNKNLNLVVIGPYKDSKYFKKILKF